MVEAHLTETLKRDAKGHVRHYFLLDANGKTVGWWYKGDWTPHDFGPVVYRTLLRVPLGEDPLVTARKWGAK